MSDVHLVAGRLSRNFPRWVTMMLLSMGVVPGAAQAAAVSVFPDPGFLNPKIAFSTGRKVDNAAELSTDLPAIPGSPSGWFIAQWVKQYYLSGKDLRTNAAPLKDNLLGAPRWSFTSPAGDTAVNIYRTPAGVTYSLFQRDGKIVPGGGSDTFLAAKPVTDATFDHMIDYDAAMRVAGAAVSYSTANAMQRNSVLMHVTSSFILKYEPGDGGKPVIAFMQVPHIDSRGAIPFYASCKLDAGANKAVLVFDSPDTGQPPIPFSSDTGPARQLHFRLNDILCALVAHPYRCNGGDASTVFRLPNDARDFSKWHILSMSVGIEGGNQNLVHRPPDESPQGSVSMDLQLSGLRVMRRDETFDGRSCSSSR